MVRARFDEMVVQEKPLTLFSRLLDQLMIMGVERVCTHTFEVSLLIETK